MTIALETANAASGETSGSSFTDTVESFSHSLQNASGNDRVVILCVSAASGQAGDLTVASVTYAGTAPTKVIATVNTSGAVREVYYNAYWDDADLPATSGSKTVAFTIGNNGSSPADKYYVLEQTGVDQTTPGIVTVTNSMFGTTGQTFTPAYGDSIIAMITAASGSTGTDPTVTWSDTELYDGASTVNAECGLSVGYATDGSITGTLSTALTSQGWIAVSFLASGSGGTPGFFIPDPRFEMPELFEPGRKPVGPVVIEWGHFLSEGLVSCINQGQDLVTDKLITDYVGSASFAKAAYQYPNDNSSNNASLLLTPTINGAQTFLISYQTTDLGASLGNANFFTHDKLRMSRRAGDELQVVNPYDRGETTSGAPSIFDGKLHTAGASVDGPISASYTDKIYIDGLEVASNVNAFGPSPASTATLLLGSSSAFSNLAGEMPIRCQWNRVLSIAEIKAFHANPYQFLIPA